MTRPMGVILAGGLASRMGGGDKGLLDINGRSLLARVIDRLSPQAGALALNANGDAARFQQFSLPVIADSIEGFVGPLAGVLAGLDWAAAQGGSAIVTVAADTPFFPTNLVDQLQAVANAKGATIALAATPDPERGHARHPTFGLWPVVLREDLRAALGAGLRKVVQWSDKHGAAMAVFDEPGDPFFNVNTPGDLERARAIQMSAAR
jgi:molybdopterin-guanine dinucleotide biosynthesis protein A